MHATLRCVKEVCPPAEHEYHFSIGIGYDGIRSSSVRICSGAIHIDCHLADDYNMRSIHSVRCFNSLSLAELSKNCTFCEMCANSKSRPGLPSTMVLLASSSPVDWSLRLRVSRTV